MVVFGLLFGGMVYVVIPGVLTFFHSRPSVRRTLAARDPQPAWTDACPLPVLGMAAFFIMGALGCLSGAVMGVFPAFGVILSGWAGSLVMLASGSLLAWLAWGFYRLRMQAWWAGLGWILVSGISTTYTFTQIGMDALYAKMGMSGETLNLMLRMAPAMKFLGWSSAAVAAITAAYLFYLLRFFQRATKAA